MDAPRDALVLDQVSYRYPQAETLSINGVSLRIPEGQCVVITGPSGCGKTTLTRLINGLVPHVYEGEVEGSVLVYGRDVSSWEVSELGTKVGSVFQNPRSQFVNIDTTSEVAFGCENLGIPREEIERRVDESVDALGARYLLGRKVEQLSGGQKQTVIIASALAMQPDVFVMDEPTASLDVDAMRLLAQAIAHLKQQGKTVIVSEHRLWWLRDVADRVIRMKEGRIVGDWRACEYEQLPTEERISAGERAWRIDEMERARLFTQGSQFAEKPLSASCFAGQESASDHEHEADCRELQDDFQNSQTEGLLEASGLEVGYGRKNTVLRDAQLSLKPGCVLGLLGKNGAGKTTLLRCLSGLTRERAGQVCLNHELLSFRKRPGKIHLVMQEPGYQLFADSALGELERAARDPWTRHSLLSEGLPSERQAAEDNALSEATEALEHFGLSALADRHPLSLSGGERQRLAIAAGILQGVQVVVLDEPTSGLDRRNMERVSASIRDLAATGRSVCIVTHDYEFLCATCDEIAELEDGCITQRYALDEAGISRARAVFGFEEMSFS